MSVFNFDDLFLTEMINFDTKKRKMSKKSFRLGINVYFKNLV